MNWKKVWKALMCDQDRPKIVCLCGSTRFPEALEEVYLKETMAGHIPLIFMCGTRKWHDDPVIKKQLDKMYKRKIELADEILVLNVGGYVGLSTANEIKHARWLGKKIRWVSELVRRWIDVSRITSYNRLW